MQVFNILRCEFLAPLIVISLQNTNIRFHLLDEIANAILVLQSLPLPWA